MTLAVVASEGGSLTVVTPVACNL